jgi:hypothetical protein
VPSGSFRAVAIFTSWIICDSRFTTLAIRVGQFPAKNRFNTPVRSVAQMLRCLLVNLVTYKAP